MLSKKEKNVLGYFSSHDVCLLSRPFLKAAQALSMSESELVACLSRLERRGMIRSLRGVMDLGRAGYKANALIAWRQTWRKSRGTKARMKDLFMREDRISHFYERRPHKMFPYNFFTMMHAKTCGEILRFARTWAENLDLDYEILYTEKELKKNKLCLKEVLC